MIAQWARRLVLFSKGESMIARWLDSSIYALKRATVPFISDEQYVRLYARYRQGRWSNLDEPRTFGEKIQWLKLNYQRPEFHRIVDKFAVREIVAERVGPEILIPLHGVYDDPDEIQVNALPESFVLKPTHGSGWVIACPDRAEFDRPSARRNLRRWMRRDHYYHAREKPYRGLPRRIVCETFLRGPDGQVAEDYKIFCFGGKPRFIEVDVGRFTGQCRNYYDTDWNLVDLAIHYPNCEQPIERPAKLDEMLKVASRLSEGFPFLRVDLYLVDSRIYFGEMTLYPGNGVTTFDPPEYDRIFGDLIELPAPTNGEVAISAVPATHAQR